MCKEICILVSHSNWWVLQVKIIGILIAWGASSWVLILSMVARLSCSSRKTTGSRWHLCTLPVHWQKLSKLKNRTLRQENVLPWTPFLQLVFANNNWNAFCCAVRKAFLSLAGFGVLRRTFGPSGVAPGGTALCTSSGLHVDPGHHFNIQWIYLYAYINVCICMYIIKIINNNSTSTVIIK